MKMRRSSARLVLFVALLVVCASILELGARLAGYKPWPQHGRLLGISEGLHQVDPVLGWRKQPGQFQIERFGRILDVTHWPADSRATAATEMDYRRRILVLGGSFAYGLGLSDQETFPWLMQRAYLGVEWLNLATSGYGTYQALLTLEERLDEIPNPPALVVYGYNWFHAERNVAADSWQYAMAISSPGIRLELPFVSLDSVGNLERRVHVYPNWPLKRYSAAVALMERVWNKFQVRGRADQARAATRKLILELDELSRSRGSRLLVMVMGRCDDLDFFRESGIEYVDCMPTSYSSDMTLPDSHPSGLRNEFYAECLASYLNQPDLDLAGP